MGSQYLAPGGSSELPSKTCPEPSPLGVCGSSQVDGNHHRTQEHQNGHTGVHSVRYTVVKGRKTPGAQAVLSMFVLHTVELKAEC